jgi:F-type H+-transporting ATPase subunit a
MKNYIVILLLMLIILLPVFADDDEETGNIMDTLFHHIMDGSTMEVFPYLPDINLPFGITVHTIMLFLSSFLIILLSFLAIRKPALKTRGLRLVMEIVVLFVRDDIVYPIMGEKKGEKWLSFFFSLFVFIFIVNSLGLIPAFKTATGSITVTLALSLMVLIIIFITGIAKLGFFGFFSNMYPKGTLLPIGIFVVFLEFTGLFIKSMVLSLRLFANMFAGHLAILSFLMLIFILHPLMVSISLPFAVFIYILEVLVALIQALVFTLLSCIFITMASSTHE